ncbi:hypothetical protein Y032_0004g2168 [Ancylostoma ceylanicum]|uniref:Uncharacterized protein n=1 Tax=Ancylostoma ceylanicum TaxID=53326 RepID=A0A016VVX2_9BILA|nr:hypothetical protein Y032_0004g2168 [Ancylostoma ceylanicum]
MKANVIRNLINTKGGICNQALAEVEEKITRILNENGYAKSEPRSWRPLFVPGGIPLVLPYVNEENAKDVNQIVRAANLPIKLVFQPSPDLKSLPTSTRICVEKCGRNNCMYCIEQKIRIPDHMSRVWREIRGRDVTTSPQAFGRTHASATYPTSYPNSSFSRHRTLHHTYDDLPRMEITVLRRSQEAPLERKVLEALATK